MSLSLQIKSDHMIMSPTHPSIQCKFGPTCRYHHPLLVPVYAGSAAVAENAVAEDNGDEDVID